VAWFVNLFYGRKDSFRIPRETQFAYVRKAPVKFITSSRPLSVRMYQRGSHWTDFSEIWYPELLLKSVKKIQIWLKSGTLREGLCSFYCCRRQQIAIKTLSSSGMVSYCYGGRGHINITRMCHTVALYVYGLPCVCIRWLWFEIVFLSGYVFTSAFAWDAVCAVH
jgi:hypothetical protein